MLAASFWAIWFQFITQLFFCLIHWQLLQGDFAEHFEIYTDAKTVTLTLLSIACYIIQSSLFLAYTYFIQFDMGLMQE